MRHKIDETSDLITVAVEGQLSFDDHEEWRLMVKKLLASPVKNIHLNMKALESIDSAGLGLVMMLRSMTSKESKNFSFDAPTEGTAAYAVKLINLHEYPTDG